MHFGQFWLEFGKGLPSRACGVVSRVELAVLAASLTLWHGFWVGARAAAGARSGRGANARTAARWGACLGLRAAPLSVSCVCVFALAREWSSFWAPPSLTQRRDSLTRRSPDAPDLRAIPEVSIRSAGFSLPRSPNLGYLLVSRRPYERSMRFCATSPCAHVFVLRAQGRAESSTPWLRHGSRCAFVDLSARALSVAASAQVPPNSAMSFPDSVF